MINKNIQFDDTCVSLNVCCAMKFSFFSLKRELSTLDEFRLELGRRFLGESKETWTRVSFFKGLSFHSMIDKI